MALPAELAWPSRRSVRCCPAPSVSRLTSWSPGCPQLLPAHWCVPAQTALACPSLGLRRANTGQMERRTEGREDGLVSPAGQGCQGGPAVLPCSCLKGGWAPPTKEPIAYCHLLQNQNIIFQDVILILVGKLITCDLPIKKPSDLRLCVCGLAHQSITGAAGGSL